MINLHERMSEFSYGYGVTREVEHLLMGLGLRTVPFLPSLIQEKKLGFDVAFDKPGAPLLLQFKLGQSLSRFVRSDPFQPVPPLARPFFRFAVDTAETDGQFETLLKAEVDGAEVYYVAPRFADWPHYVKFYEDNEVLEKSVLITPGAIDSALDAKGATAGRHRIVYDQRRVYVCSKPVQIEEARPLVLAERVAVRARDVKVTLGQRITRIFSGLEDRASVRRRRPEAAIQTDLSLGYLTAPALRMGERQLPELTNRQRVLRLAHLRGKTASDIDARAAVLGLELWGLGIQMLLVVD